MKEGKEKSVKELEQIKSKTNDERLKEKIDEKLKYINKPLSK